MTLPANFKRPMLAINYDDVSEQPSLVYCSEKLDGIRVLFFGGVAYSRSLKPLPNKILQKLAQDNAEVLEGCDGEVIAGDKYAIDVLQRSNSFCMKADKQDDFSVYLFDKFHESQPWFQRYGRLLQMEDSKVLPKQVKVLEHYCLRAITIAPYDGYPIDSPFVKLDEFEANVLAKGGEGVILRDGFGVYKQNRSGKKKPELQKVKRFHDIEAVVIAYNQYETNLNQATTDERGFTKRSTSKEGKELVDALGGLVLVLPNGIQFSCGSGFTAEQRKELWQDKEALIGKTAKVQHFGFSPDGVPLLPVFLDFRSELDM